MNILVLGGTHGDEMLGVELVKSLRQNPIASVDSLLANPRAITANKRFVESDLNRSFGTQKQETYESRRAQKLSKIISLYDVVLDFHNTQTPDNNCCFVGQACHPVLYSVAKKLGLSDCIEATYDCVNKYCLNVLSIEISIGNDVDSVDYWRSKISQLVQEELPSSGIRLLMYRFLRRVTWQEKKTLVIQNWRPFVELGDSDKTALSVSGTIAPIFIGSCLTEFYATLITKIGEK